MIDTSVRLFQRQGYRATSWRALVNAGATPWGSVQHHFPGGKEELGVAAVARAAELVETLLQATFDATDDPAEGTRAWFAASGALLESTDFADGCPVAPVALEMSIESSPLASACAAAFGRWRDVVSGALGRAGVDAPTAQALATAVISGFEGAMILARAQRSSEPLVVVGEVLAATVENQLAAPRQ